MATSEQVKQYLACWFQLNKHVVSQKGQRWLPQSVFSGEDYSSAFESCWQEIQAQAGQCHLEGTSETIAHLLSDHWELSNCARCSMPVPVDILGKPPEVCPCHDMSSWPNLELPKPRLPANNRSQLRLIQRRLLQLQRV